MIEKRKHSRVDCATKCILYHEGSKFRGVVENLSISGALVRIRENPSKFIHPGDDCSLLICHIPALSYSRHACQVIHLDSSAIGIEFLFLADGKRTRLGRLKPPLRGMRPDSHDPDEKRAAP